MKQSWNNSEHNNQCYNSNNKIITIIGPLRYEISSTRQKHVSWRSMNLWKEQTVKKQN